ncbi:DUF2057 domain-containing protein [Acinetobacter sp. ANC 4648]|uniref:YccT family protein n=1 Tax=Acinetobacter sp. ANC 4648 TaxID=1977875 RepID=UPI000A34BB6B|nr:DUF2057 domain-containing protein [Acinetobacter sp. ANC 4648]OTG82927.1 hypothetical protein B9T27_06560 [Acinetobacter sp. ANC 4648]
MTFKLSTAVFGLMMSSSIFAAVTISVPEEIVMLAVNDQEINVGFLRNKKNDYKVDAGNASLSVRYQQYFEHLNGEHDILKSGIVTIQAPDLKDGQTYKLALVNPPQSFDAAKVYATQPTIAIYDKNNQLLVQQTGANNQPKPWLSSGIFGQVLDLTQKKSTTQPAAIYAQKSSIPTVVSTPIVSPQAISNSIANTADQQLIQIWQKATKVERQRFMSWLAEQ